MNRKYKQKATREKGISRTEDMKLLWQITTCGWVKKSKKSKAKQSKYNEIVNLGSIKKNEINTNMKTRIKKFGIDINT